MYHKHEIVERAKNQGRFERVKNLEACRFDERNEKLFRRLVRGRQVNLMKDPDARYAAASRRCSSTSSR